MCLLVGCTSPPAQEAQRPKPPPGAPKHTPYIVPRPGTWAEAKPVVNLGGGLSLQLENRAHATFELLGEPRWADPATATSRVSISSEANAIASKSEAQSNRQGREVATSSVEISRTAGEQGRVATTTDLAAAHEDTSQGKVASSAGLTSTRSEAELARASTTTGLGEQTSAVVGSHQSEVASAAQETVTLTAAATRQTAAAGQGPVSETRVGTESALSRQRSVSLITDRAELRKYADLQRIRLEHVSSFFVELIGQDRVFSQFYLLGKEEFISLLESESKASDEPVTLKKSVRNLSGAPFVGVQPGVPFEFVLTIANMSEIPLEHGAIYDDFPQSGIVDGAPTALQYEGVYTMRLLDGAGKEVAVPGKTRIDHFNKRNEKEKGGLMWGFDLPIEPHQSLELAFQATFYRERGSPKRPLTVYRSPDVASPVTGTAQPDDLIEVYYRPPRGAQFVHVMVVCADGRARFDGFLSLDDFTNGFQGELDWHDHWNEILTKTLYRAEMQESSQARPGAPASSPPPPPAPVLPPARKGKPSAE